MLRINRYRCVFFLSVNRILSKTKGNNCPSKFCSFQTSSMLAVPLQRFAVVALVGDEVVIALMRNIFQ